MSAASLPAGLERRLVRWMLFFLTKSGEQPEALAEMYPAIKKAKSRTESGTILVEVPPPREGGRTAVDARVSSYDQRCDLDRQVARITRWATEQRLAVDEVVTEVGSGSKRDPPPKLRRLLADARVTTIFVVHRDCTGSQRFSAVGGRRQCRESGRRRLQLNIRAWSESSR